MTNEELLKTDISNLRFYARMASEFKWGTDVMHFGVIVSTLEAIADRLGAVVLAPPQPRPMCDYTGRPCLDSTQICRCGTCQTFAAKLFAAPSQEPRLMISRSGEIHEWCPDCRGDCCSPYKAAQEQPVENSITLCSCEFPVHQIHPFQHLCNRCGKFIGERP